MFDDGFWLVNIVIVVAVVLVFGALGALVYTINQDDFKTPMTVVMKPNEQREQELEELRAIRLELERQKESLEESAEETYSDIVYE